MEHTVGEHTARGGGAYSWGSIQLGEHTAGGAYRSCLAEADTRVTLKIHLTILVFVKLRWNPSQSRNTVGSRMMLDIGGHACQAPATYDV